MQFEDPTGTLMMLPTDMCLVEDAAFKPFVEEFAKVRPRLLRQL